MSERLVLVVARNHVLGLRPGRRSWVPESALANYPADLDLVVETIPPDEPTETDAGGDAASERDAQGDSPTGDADTELTQAPADEDVASDVPVTDPAPAKAASKRASAKQK